MNEQKEQANQTEQEVDLTSTEQAHAEETEFMDQDAKEVEAEAQAEAETEAEVNPLQAKLDEALATIAAQKDTVLRAQAESDNVRRRSAQDAEKARKFALEKFVKELLPVIDNLERALQAESQVETEETANALKEGVELTLKSFLETVAKFGVEPVNPEQGEVFNPDVHQAISMVPGTEQAANTVILVMQKGYQLNGRLVRPAMVTVAQG
tara:strand:+ start:298 stop:927 length:630 start_codon:yes stop_codon:yes gene_type:complete